MQNEKLPILWHVLRCWRNFLKNLYPKFEQFCTGSNYVRGALNFANKNANGLGEFLQIAFTARYKIFESRLR